MVKNKKGGSGHKKMARKFVKNNDYTSRKVREATDEDEMYAKVVKVNGGSVFEVLCNDKVVRQMVVRNKFKGRNKRDNTLAIDTMVLIGRRSWQVLTGKKKEKVDLLEVYNKNDLVKLKNFKNICQDILPAGESKETVDDGFDFDNTVEEDVDDETKNQLEQNINKKLETVTETANDDIDIDWDDI